MDLRSFLLSFLTTFALFVFFVLVFIWLSRKPGNMVIYYPNRIEDEITSTEDEIISVTCVDTAVSPPTEDDLKTERIDKRSPPTKDDLKTRSPFAWIKESFTSTEDKIISVSGVDTAVYFVFLSTVLKILVSSGTFLLPSLLPIAWTGKGIFIKVNCTLRIDGNFSNLERFSMANVEDKSPRLWAFLLATYVVSFSTFYMLWKAYNHVSELRVTALKAPKPEKPEQYAIMVSDIPAGPEGMTRKAQVDSYFKSLYADEFYASWVITDNKEVNKICKDLRKYRNKLAHAAVKFAASKTTGKPEGTRPICKKWFLLGKKIDKINYCQEKIKTLVPKLRKEQENTIREKQKNSALIFFKNRKAATSVAKTIHEKKTDKWTVGEAPEPRQVLWENFGLGFYQRQLKKAIVYLIVALTILFFMIPTMIISAFSVGMSTKKEKFGEPFKGFDKLIFLSVWEVLAYLPQIVLISFLSVLPKFLMFLSKVEGIPSVSQVVRASLGKNFYFTVLNVFIGVNISVAVFRTGGTKIWMLLGQIVAQNATFFLSFVALKFFVGYGLELSRLSSFICFYLKKKFLCRTAAEVKKAWAPGDMNYAFRVSDDLLIVTIVLCYSVIAPVIILFGAAYFSIGWLVLRNQALNVYVPSYESYGRMWPHLHARILVALIIFQLTMMLSFSLKNFNYATYLVIPLPILSIAFMIVCRRKFYYNFHNTHLEVVCTEMTETPNLEAIYKAYTPPCLRSEDKAQPDDDALSAPCCQLPGFQSLL